MNGIDLRSDSGEAMTRRNLSTTEREELRLLNDAVLLALKVRRKWLDEKMAECSAIQVGDDIYDLDTGKRLGRVRRLYRYWRDREFGIRDDFLSFDYEYEVAPGQFSNTSSQPSRRFGLKP